MSIKLRLAIALILVAAMLVALWFWYLPEHWLGQAKNFATVTVNDRPVQADTYIGNPDGNEADAFLLVRINAGANYLFNLDAETYREVSSREFVRLGRGLFVFKPVSRGKWVSPLPFRNVNEFRVKSLSDQLTVVRF